MLPPRGEGREDSKGSTVGGLQEGKRRRFKKGLGGDEGDSEGTAVTERERERKCGPEAGPIQRPKELPYPAILPPLGLSTYSGVE